MKRFLILLIALMQSWMPSRVWPDETDQPATGVTYLFSGGRLGDNLLAYIHAKYISYVFHIPMLYKPFQFSEQFVLDKVERKWNENMRGEFDQIVHFQVNEDYAKFQERNALYIVPYFPEFEGEYGTLYNGPWFDMDWNAPGFLKEMRKMIKPVNPTKSFPRQKNAINVAVHMRKGSGPDSNEMTKMYFLKFPPDEFYIEQLIKISTLFPKQAIYAYLFTDYQNPKELAERLKKKLKSFPITFGYRDTVGSLENVIVEDFFGMMQYDCIIRAEANVSYIASRLGNFMVEIYPMHGYWSGDRKVIDQVGIIDKRK